jgi:hypothetical protein
MNTLSFPRRRESSHITRRSTTLVLLAGFASALAWAALTPLPSGSREALYVIPKGTWARRMAGENLDILPQELRLVLEVRDTLVLRNDDDVPQVFGPVLIMPGQSFTMPFRQAATYQFACSLHVSGQLNVIVQPAPAPGWERLRWRAAGMGSRMAWL